MPDEDIGRARLVESMNMVGERWKRAAAAVCAVAAVSVSLSGVSAHAGSDPKAYVIADSVLLGAKSVLKERGFRVDAVEGRRPTRVLSALRKLPQDGRPAIVHLGNNGPFTAEVCDDLQKVVQGERHVVFVTIHAPRKWTRGTNDVIRGCIAGQAAEYSASLVPWHRLAREDVDLLYSDGIHLTPEGADYLAGVLDEHLRKLDRREALVD